jgi:hypothetical protein
VTVRPIGIPADRFVDHGSVGDLRRLIAIDEDGIETQVREALATLRATPARTETPTAIG